MAEVTTGDTIMQKPYMDSLLKDNEYIRCFSSNVEESLLVWHRDKKDRLITVVAGENWLLQFDNLMPMELVIGMVYVIPRNKYHRIHKGKHDLILAIKEE